MASEQTLQSPKTSTTNATTTTWDIEPLHSDATFAIKHLMIATVRGGLRIKSGILEWNEAAPETSHISAELDVATIQTGVSDRDAHLRSADFFDAENHPTLRYESVRIEPLGDEKYRIHGNLTIRGVTKPVILEAEKEGEAADPWGKHRVGVSATTRIDRRDFGLTWNQALETGGIVVGTDVKITLNVEAVRRD